MGGAAPRRRGHWDRRAHPGATDEELEAAAARARLPAWIRSLPQGWDTRAGTRGAAVSGGERQRLALARAFLASPALLILDEPTAHLDPHSRQALTADLLHATEGRAVLFITRGRALPADAGEQRLLMLHTALTHIGAMRRPPEHRDNEDG